MSANNTVYQIVNDRITALLSAGVIPWRQPWHLSLSAKNLVSKKPYKGINRWLLNSLAYDNNNFVTYHQARELGGAVKKGAHGYPVIFWKWLEYPAENPDTAPEPESAGTGKTKNIPFLRYYTVFNVNQCEGIPADKIPPLEYPALDFNPVPVCENTVNGYTDRPEIKHGGAAAFYSPDKDYVNMPPVDSFLSVPGYYAVLLHELGHSTGHEKRLGRSIKNRFGSRDYAAEELVAEFTSSYLCAVCGIDKPVIENSAAYIQNWLSVLKNKDNARLLVIAAGQAEKAADYILNNPHKAQSEFESAA